MDLLNQARALAPDERAELQSLRSARDATEKAQRIANSLRDEYETLLIEVEREKNEVMQAQIRQATQQGNTHALTIIEDLRAARMSLGRRDGQQQHLQQQLAKARMSCTRHRNVARALQEEAEMFCTMDGDSAAVKQLKEENKALRQEVGWREEETAKALDSAAAKDSRIASLEAQCAMLTAQLHGACIDAATKNEKLRESVAQVLAEAQVHGPEDDAAARLAEAMAQCERLAADLEGESVRLSERTGKVQELEELLAQSRAAAAKREEVIEEQLASMDSLNKQLVETLQEKTSNTAKLGDLETELAQRETRIVQLTAEVERAGRAVEESSMFMEFKAEIENLKHALAGARLSTQRRDQDITALTARREDERHADALQLTSLQERCEHAEEEARQFFVQAEQLADMTGELQRSRMSTARHVEAEAELRSQLDSLKGLIDIYEQKQRAHENVTRKLEAEHKDYCATLFTQLNKEKTQAAGDIALYQSQMEVVKAEKTAAEEKAAEATKALQEMTDRHDELLAELEVVRGGELREAEVKVATLAKEVEVARAALAERDEALEAEVKELAAARAEVAALQEGAEAAEVERNDAADSITNLEMELGLREIKIAEMQEAIMAVKEDVSAARLSVARRTDAVQDKTTELATAKKALEKAKREVTKFKNQAEKLPALQKEMKGVKKAAEQASEQAAEDKATLEALVQEMKDEYHAAMREKDEEIAELKTSTLSYKEQSSSLMANAERQAQELKAMRGAADKQDTYREKLEKMMKINMRLKAKLQEKQREVMNMPSPSPIVPFEVDASYRCAGHVQPLQRLDLNLEPPSLSHLTADAQKPSHDAGDARMFSTSPSTSPVVRKPARRARKYALDDDMPAPPAPVTQAAKKTSRLSLRI